MSKLDWWYKNHAEATDKDVEELRQELLSKKAQGTLNKAEDEDSILKMTEPDKEGQVPTRLTHLQMMFAMYL